MIWSIQYLRFFACLMVVTLHLTNKASLNDGGGGYLFFGASGVDLFFVISGFIMSYISEKKELGPVEFFKNRVLRIYPIYLVTLIPFLFVFLLFPEIVNTHSETPSILKSITLLPFLNGGSLNMVAWTLSYEFYFYLIFSAALILRKDAILTSTAILLVIMSVGNAFNVKFIGATISLEFVFGMLIFSFIYKKISIGKKMAIFLILTGLGWICFSSSVEVGGDGFARVFHYGIPSALIFIGFLSDDLFTKKISFLSSLGDASYSVYLTHILTINAVYLAFKEVGMQNKMYYLMIIVGIILSMAVGFFIHKKIELPLTEKVKLIPFFHKKTSQNR
ncbi:acyltransferase family protein [Tatumella sp. UBA2305]|uniref:acyltransferase family protein n=1 Tax=Tatumella sp. UBA2305 TaxID=1947647 RepID=UPI0025ECAD76|nr:acyltransferase [Tatumella sp. UBA2305]